MVEKKMRNMHIMKRVKVLYWPQTGWLFGMMVTTVFLWVARVAPWPALQKDIFMPTKRLFAATKTSENKQNTPSLSEECDMLNMTQNEFKMLASLGGQQRRFIALKDASARERERLQVMTGVLRKTLEKIHEKETLLARMTHVRTEEEKRMTKKLVKTFETMKPQEAASILLKMDAAHLIFVLQQLKGEKVADILAAMPPSEAAHIGVIMTNMARGVH